ncbi:uncharacterized protein LOC143883075 [Tasmannia lanceolata]|uniref:uncharacterized protein LOC143883075 n=1 Tax=Tasmannia lanceolata TaxID=3420 RepID=UPI0040646A3B
MDECRGYEGNFFSQKVQRYPPRSQIRRPPQGCWQPTVTSWEKKFCSSVCSISWKQLCETKDLMSYYENIAQWNDSSGEEAFHNAKARFWAEINGLPCDISLPNPDIYIDEIDWNSNIDPELLLDLDKKPLAPSDEEKNEKLGWDPFNLSNFPIPCTGWGDDEDPVHNSPAESFNYPFPCTGWGDAEDPVNDSRAEPAWGNFDLNVDNDNAKDWIGWENRCGAEFMGNDGAKGHVNCDGNANNYDTHVWSRWESRAKEDNSWENSGGNSWENRDVEGNSWEQDGLLETNNGNCWRRQGGA